MTKTNQNNRSDNRKIFGNKKNETFVINQIVIKAPGRKSYDVGDWRAALRSADMGRVKSLYDLYEDVLIDGVLADAVQKRVDAVTNAELTFQNADGGETDEITDLIDTPAWEELLSGIVKAKIYGRSAVEIDCVGELSVTPIPPKHINLDNHTILIRDTDEKGIVFEAVNGLLVFGKNHDYGLLLKAAPYAIYKRGGFGDWAQWIELFGMPQRVGKYNTYDPESRKLLEEAFEHAGSAPYVVIPKEAEVETKEGGTGSGASYNEFRQACNEEMLISVLGQTMTTVQGEKGARSLGEVHKEVEESKNKSDLRYVQRMLNRYVLPFLEARGYPVAGGKFVFPKAVEALTVDEIVQLSDIMDIPQSYLHEKYAIPVPGDGEPVAKRMPQGVYGAVAEDNDDEIDTEPVAAADRNFLARLRDFFVEAPQDGAHTIGGARMMLSDGVSLKEGLIARVVEGHAKCFDTELFAYLSDDLLNAVQTAFKKGVKQADAEYGYGLADDAFITAMEMNLFVFSAAKTLAEIQELNRVFRESKDYAEFSQKAGKICDTFNQRWQKTEYETALLTAESASNYRHLKGKTKLFPYWKYVTAGDNKVRDEHQKLNGIMLSVDDPRWNKIFPPNGWKCRCRIAPIMRHEADGIDIAAMRQIVDEYFGTPEWKINAAQGWDVNRGDTAEVFGKNQYYIKRFPEKAAKSVGNLHASDYKLESFSKRAAKATDTMPVFSGNPLDWYRSHQTLPDYKGRKVSFPEAVFKRYTAKKYETEKIPLLESIAEVVKKPDEVWLNGFQKDGKNLNFIKFYADGSAVCVVCEVKDGEVYRVITWHRIKADAGGKGGENPKLLYRSGLLIKK